MPPGPPPRGDWGRDDFGPPPPPHDGRYGPGGARGPEGDWWHGPRGGEDHPVPPGPPRD